MAGMPPEAPRWSDRNLIPRSRLVLPGESVFVLGRNQAFRPEDAPSRERSERQGILDLRIP